MGPWGMRKSGRDVGWCRDDEEAQGKGGVRVGLEYSILDRDFDGVVLCRVRKLKGPDNEGC